MRKYLVIAWCILVLVSCKKVEVDQYEVNPVEVGEGNGTKGQRKSDLQLMSIMFTDVFGRSISQDELQTLVDTYSSFGDKQAVVDRLTWRFLSDPSADLPPQSMWDNDPDGLIVLLFERYLSRSPGEMEKWYFREWMNENPDLEVKHLAYVLLISEEYKYY